MGPVLPRPTADVAVVAGIVVAIVVLHAVNGSTVGAAVVDGVGAVVAGAAGADEGAALVVWSVGVGWSTVVADVWSPPACPRAMTSTATAAVRRAATTAPLTSSQVRGRRRTDGADGAGASCTGAVRGGDDSNGAVSTGSGVERW